jgi:N-acetylmuramic acid 6-phosphate etherase
MKTNTIYTPSDNVTEQNSHYDQLENKTIKDILHEMNHENCNAINAVHDALQQIEQVVEQVVNQMKQGGRLFYVGAGTSGRLGVLDASEIPPTFGMDKGKVVGIIAGGDIALKQSVENAEDNTNQGWIDLLQYNVNQADIVIGIAASGKTPYVAAALQQAKQHGIPTAAIVCNTNSLLKNIADNTIELVVGPEYVTGSSRLKAGTAQKLTLNMISTATMIKLGKVKGNKMINMQLTNKKLQDRGTKMIAEELNVDYQQAKQLLMKHGSVKKAIEETQDNNHA